MSNYLSRQGIGACAFNFGEHGNGKMLSKVENAIKGDYGFDKMVTEEMPAIVKFVKEKTKLDIYIAGHSMGGMVAKQYMSGVTEISPGKIIISDSVAKARASEVKGIITLGSPGHFDNMPEVFKLFGKIGKYISVHEKVDVPMVGAVVTGEWIGHKRALAIRRAFAKLTIGPAHKLPKFLINLDNFSDEELVNLVSDAMTGAKKHISTDFMRWANHGYSSRDGLNYRIPQKIYVDQLNISGDNDGLAPSKIIQEEMKTRAKLREYALTLKEKNLPGKVHYMEFENTAHLDLVGDRASDAIGPWFVKFANNPETIISTPDQPLKIESPAVCGRKYNQGAVLIIIKRTEKLLNSLAAVPKFLKK